MKSPQTKKRRLAGRPGGESDGRQQQSLLQAAETLFATRGYAATPLREIAEQASVNPALIHYYWGSKSGLLRAVMDEVFEPMADAMASLPDSPGGISVPVSSTNRSWTSGDLTPADIGLRS